MQSLAGPGSILSEGIVHGSQNVCGYLLARISASKIQNSAENISSPENTRRTEALAQSVKCLHYKHGDMSLDTQNPGKSQSW